MNIRTEILIENLPNCETQGKDPRKLSKEEIEKCGFVDKPIMKVIREMCLSCVGNGESGDSNEVLKCTAVNCPLWIYRTGKNVLRKKELSEEERTRISERFKKNKD